MSAGLGGGLGIGKSMNFQKPSFNFRDKIGGGFMGGLGSLKHGRAGSGIGAFRNRSGGLRSKSRKLPGAPNFAGLDGHMGSGFAPSRPMAPEFGGFGGFMGNDFKPGSASDW